MGDGWNLKGDLELLSGTTCVFLGPTYPFSQLSPFICNFMTQKALIIAFELQQHCCINQNFWYLPIQSGLNYSQSDSIDVAPAVRSEILSDENLRDALECMISRWCDIKRLVSPSPTHARSSDDPEHSNAMRCDAIQSTAMQANVTPCIGLDPPSLHWR